MKIILETSNGHTEYDSPIVYKDVKKCFMKELKKEGANFATFIVSHRDEPFIRNNVTILKYWEFKEYGEIKERFKDFLKSVEYLCQTS